MGETKWNDIEKINDGNAYKNGDAVKVADFNKILENINYLKNQLDGRND